MFIRVARPLQAGKLTLEPNQIRLLRRLVRDYYRRASEPEFTLFLWKGVRENEERSIFPYAAQCHAQLDSTMGYELGMLRPYLENILPSILTSDDYGNIAAAILHDIKEIPQLSCELLPEIALYREFVGKQQ
jgi:uridine kinase